MVLLCANWKSRFAVLERNEDACARMIIVFGHGYNKLLHISPENTFSTPCSHVPNLQGIAEVKVSDALKVSFASRLPLPGASSL